MKKLTILRSVTGKARAYADRHFRYFTFFDDPELALQTLKDTPVGDRPWFVVVDAGMGTRNASFAPLAMNLGYQVEVKGVP